MIILDTITKTLEVVLGNVQVTNALPFVASYVDVTSTTYTPAETDGVTNGLTAVTLVTHPASSTQRQIKFLSIQNADTIVSTVIVRYNNNTTIRNMIQASIPINGSLVYTDGEGFRVLDSNGSLVQTTNAGITGSQGPAGPPLFLVGENGEDGFVIPGGQGPAGLAGVQGPQGVATFLVGEEGEMGMQGFSIVGPQGIQGQAGAPGYAATSTTSLTMGIGSQSFITQIGLAYSVGARIRLASNGTPADFWEGTVTAYDSVTTGSMTVTFDTISAANTHADWNLNLAGVVGPTGFQGPTGPVIDFGDQPEMDMMLVPPNQPNNWKFLGTVSGSGVTVGPVIWFDNYQFLFFRYIIAGYSGGTPVGRFLCGAGTPATGSATNANSLITDVTLGGASVSTAGCPLAVTVSALPRQGHGFVSGASGSFKQIEIFGMSGTPSVTTAPTHFSGRSFFSDLSTNLPIKQAQLTVYDAISGTTISTNQFLAGTQLWVWGLSTTPQF